MHPIQSMQLIVNLKKKKNLQLDKTVMFIFCVVIHKNRERENIEYKFHKK